MLDILIVFGLLAAIVVLVLLVLPRFTGGRNHGDPHTILGD